MCNEKFDEEIEGIDFRIEKAGDINLIIHISEKSKKNQRKFRDLLVGQADKLIAESKASQ